MNQDKPPTYSETTGNPYKTLVNEAFVPTQAIPQNPYQLPMQNVYTSPQNSYQPAAFPYGNPIVVASVQQPTPVQAGTTVNVNTGPIEKRYCCSCCCTCWWIIIIIAVIILVGSATKHRYD